jgi:t-SNARE complex subunit (syntaxin)
MASAAAKVRLTVRVSKTTDRDVRALLGARKMRRGELSKFVEEAVQRQLLRVMVDDIQRRNAKVDRGQLQADIDRAVKEVRAERKHLSQRKKNGGAKDAAVA